MCLADGTGLPGDWPLFKGNPGGLGARGDIFSRAHMTDVHDWFKPHIFLVALLIPLFRRVRALITEGLWVFKSPFLPLVHR